MIQGDASNLCEPYGFGGRAAPAQGSSTAYLFSKVPSGDEDRSTNKEVMLWVNLHLKLPMSRRSSTGLLRRVLCPWRLGRFRHRCRHQGSLRPLPELWGRR